MMPDNVIYYQIAYGAVAVLYVAYAASIAWRRRTLARRRGRAGGAPG